MNSPAKLLAAALTVLVSLPISIRAEDIAASATPVSLIKVRKDFRVELLHSVPKPDQGSWVAMCLDDKGRLIASDQYGPLYRITPPAPGGSPSETKIERIDLPIGHAQGLVHAFGSLYVVVNDDAFQGRGLYRVRDTNGDDQYDKIEQLRAFKDRAGEHGPHAVLVGPDGKSLYVVVGNQTPLTDFDESRVPKVWQEDILLPRIYGRGFMRDALAPRGWIARTDPDGRRWELLITGFRNEYDAAFNHEGDLFTFDADMEWDMNCPWYRPTRVCQVLSGSEFGWRNGSAKWPVRWEDSAPPVVDIGPGSPTGVTFGYGAKFPAKYQEAFFINDWSYGKMYAVHLKPEGAGYAAEFEEFVSGQPLPLTDVVVNPRDGAMYFAIGGRRVQSGLYRVTYTGSDDTTPKPSRLEGEAKKAHEARRSLEAFHGRQDPKAVDLAWPHLSHADRLIRNAARIALEHQPAAQWESRALAEKNPRAALTALMALCRVGDKGLQPRVVEALERIPWDRLDTLGQTTLVRIHALCFMRLGEPSSAQRKHAINRFAKLFPQKDLGLNQDLCEMLVYLGDPSIVAKAVPLVNTAPTQEEQIAYAKSLRLARNGWTKPLRAEYFKWFPRAANYTGGASFALFIEDIKRDAVAGLSEAEKRELDPILSAKPEARPPVFAAKNLQFVKNWTMKDFEKSLGAGLEGGRNFENGRNCFGAVGCFSCHRLNMEGGAVGPDLTSAPGKFSPRDLLEQIIDPSKEISDQYGSLVFTLDDGNVVMGRIVNMKEDTVLVNTNMMDPNALTPVPRNRIKAMEASRMSMMPPGLVNTLTEDDILDLLAYLLAKGDRNSPLFR